MKIKLQLVKALRPKQAFFRAYRTSSNHGKSMFFQDFAACPPFSFYFDGSIYAGPLDKGGIEPSIRNLVIKQQAV